MLNESNAQKLAQIAKEGSALVLGGTVPDTAETMASESLHLTRLALSQIQVHTRVVGHR